MLNSRMRIMPLLDKGERQNSGVARADESRSEARGNRAFGATVVP